MRLENPDALAGRPKVEIADLFREYSHLLPKPLHREAAKVVRDIIDCRTRKLGGHVRQCTDCEHEEISYNSCRNRHCPKCQFLARARWVQARTDELLPVEYFHVVFTLPHEFNALIRQNKAALYGLLFESASATLKEVASTRLGGEPGFVAVLHTWDQRLLEHNHLHMIVPGGGLKTDANSKDEWVSCKRGFLLPIEILSKVFRGKFLSGLEKLRTELKFEGQLQSIFDPRRFKKYLQTAARKDWIVYAKPPFAGPKQVIEYLGNYTHRVAISNYRILKVQDGRVTFRYRDSAHNNSYKQMQLPAQEFMRRFLLHVLPNRFVRIRHYGFLGNRYRKLKITRLKGLFGLEGHAIPSGDPNSAKPDWKETLNKLTGHDVTVCPQCRTGKMIEVRTIESFYNRRRIGRRFKAWDTS